MRSDMKKTIMVIENFEIDTVYKIQKFTRNRSGISQQVVNFRSSSCLHFSCFVFFDVGHRIKNKRWGWQSLFGVALTKRWISMDIIIPVCCLFNSSLTLVSIEISNLKT